MNPAKQNNNKMITYKLKMITLSVNIVDVFITFAFATTQTLFELSLSDAEQNSKCLHIWEAAQPFFYTLLTYNWLIIKTVVDIR